MKTKTLWNAMAIAALSLSALGASHTILAGGDRTRLECRDASALQDASMKARHEQDAGRAKFSVEIEVLPGGGLVAGDILEVHVGEALVGRITLVQGPVDLGAELNFDTTAGPLDADSPFPANFPAAVAPGTPVRIGAELGCSLQAR